MLDCLKSCSMKFLPSQPGSVCIENPAAIRERFTSIATVRLQHLRSPYSIFYQSKDGNHKIHPIKQTGNICEY
jgi:hypothetical protein